MARHRLPHIWLIRWMIVGALLAAANGVLAGVARADPPKGSGVAVSGAAVVGQRLSAEGTWTSTEVDPTVTIAYQWQQCAPSDVASCSPIPGANDPSYVVATANVGRQIRVLETATDSKHDTASAPSPPTAVVPPVPTSTALVVAPPSVVTNQPVTLVASVSASAGIATPPPGSVTFENGGAPIPNCSNLSFTGLPVVCQPWFGAAAPPHLTAVFTPRPDSPFLGSTSAAYDLPVGRDSTSTALDVSNPAVDVGDRATYMATVTPGHPGSIQPYGTVAFFDDSAPIASCARQPLSRVNGLPTATCTVSYDAPGEHSISASYSGERNFGSSTSASAQISVHALPAKVLGTIHSTMQWTFAYTRSYTKVLELRINSTPVGSKVLVICHGHGCPFRRRATSVQRKPCKRRCSRPRTVDLTPRFHRHRLRVGAQITIEIVRPSWIGKYYRFTIRAQRSPRVQISCLAPGEQRPGLGC